MSDTATPQHLSNPQAPTTFSYSTEAPPQIARQDYVPLRIFGEDNPLLKVIQEPVDINNFPTNIVDITGTQQADNMIDLANRMLATIHKHGGVGLAANQCGFPIRMFVIVGAIVCINPSIVESSPEMIRDKEGCLSYPALWLPVNRPKTVKVRFYNEFGQLKEETYTGATARVFQHELDHLNGVLFTSRVGSLTLQMAKKKKQKLMKKVKRIVEYKQRLAALTDKKPQTASVSPL